MHFQNLYKFKLSKYFFLLLFTNNTLYAEGTKEIRPKISDHGSLQLFAINGTNETFAIRNGSPDQRLNVHVCKPGEVVYLGFNYKDNFRLRVMDPLGNEVIAKETNVGAGIINTYEEAVAGPKVLNAAGYNALQFTANVIGDYYIEFEPIVPLTDNNESNFDLFDITVADNGIVKTGRSME